MYICICIYIYVYVYVYIYIYIYVYTYSRTHLAYVHMYMCVCIHAYRHMHIIHVCVYTCVVVHRFPSLVVFTRQRRNQSTYKTPMSARSRAPAAGLRVRTTKATAPGAHVRALICGCFCTLNWGSPLWVSSQQEPYYLYWGP